jgi:hypothetical protein
VLILLPILLPLLKNGPLSADNKLHFLPKFRPFAVKNEYISIGKVEAPIEVR